MEIGCSCGAVAFIEKKAIKMPERSVVLYEIKCPKCHQIVIATQKNMAIRNWNK